MREHPDDASTRKSCERIEKRRQLVQAHRVRAMPVSILT